MRVVAARRAVVRLTDGGTVALAAGAAVPSSADPGHVEKLAARGVLVDAPKARKPRARKPEAEDQPDTRPEDQDGEQ
ncbi:hypothetical protein [Nocardioides sp. GY 10127]|uniref:hypothetical protein n=1 Tax=Nocardioides sp. GY 10127 TaxID=2569762 RepID=UPI0010A8CAA6|nr:hypothetical protein [Nocardioides sp. GY 10127]TIC78782.1 hypothetical protein E8D37_18985 [Nocardioides sp. GY 10127]